MKFLQKNNFKLKIEDLFEDFIADIIPDKILKKYHITNVESESKIIYNAKSKKFMDRRDKRLINGWVKAEVITTKELLVCYQYMIFGVERVLFSISYDAESESYETSFSMGSLNDEYQLIYHKIGRDEQISYGLILLDQNKDIDYEQVYDDFNIENRKMSEVTINELLQVCDSEMTNFIIKNINYFS